MEVTRQNLVKWRNQARLTQDELGKKLGVSKGTVANYETGRTASMTHEAMVRLHALMNPETDTPRPSARNGAASAFREQLVRELRDLADFIERKELPGQVEAKKFASVITFYHDALDEYAAAIAASGQ